jgi:Putative esterase
VVDCWTSLGGGQFLDSPGTGNYLTYLCDEVVPFVDQHYRTIADREHRGIQGKSSGGYGAMVAPMLRPDVWGGLATHVGDALFEVCYLPEFRDSVRALRDDYEGSYEEFWADFRSRPAMSKESDGVLMNNWCMAACYSTDEDGTVRLPFDIATGELIPEIWKRWLELDPVLARALTPGRINGLSSRSSAPGWFTCLASRKSRVRVPPSPRMDHKSISPRTDHALQRRCRRTARDAGRPSRGSPLRA